VGADIAPFSCLLSSALSSQALNGFHHQTDFLPYRHPGYHEELVMTTPTKTNPVIFIHGLWIHSTAWAPWIELFESRGYSASAPGWPGDGPTVAATRENPDALNDMGIPQMVDHYAQLIGTPAVKPVVVGHSFGGLIAQELLANGVVAAAVAIDPAAIKGVKALPLAQLKSAFPVLGNPANLHRTVSLTPKQFHYGFGNTLTEEESDALRRLVNPRCWSAAVPGRRRELLPALTSQGRHPPG
jgi:pimeloyl-ACP methyl ester carboxylesterase